MAQQIFQVQAKDGIVRLNDNPTVNQLQSFDWTPSLNEEYYRELGNEAYAGQSIEPEVSVTFDSNGIGATAALLSRLWAQYDPGTGEFLGYAFEQANPNTATIRSTDLENMVADIIEHKQPNEIFDRSLVIPRAFLSNLSISASVDGSANESYTFEGETTEVYKKPFHDVRTVPGSRTDDNTFDITDYWADVPGGSLGADWVILKIFIDSEVISDLSTVTATDSTGAAPTTVDISGDSKIAPEGSRIMCLIAKETPGTFPTIYDPTGVTPLRASDIDLFLIDPGTVDLYNQADGDVVSYAFDENDLFLRVQSVTFDVPLGREALRQIRRTDRGTSVYHRAATFPLEVSASMSVFETDLSDWAKIQSKPTGEMTDPYDFTEVLNMTDFENVEWQLVAVYYDDAANVQQVVALCDARVAGRGSSVAVDGRTEVSWEMTGSKFLVEGTDVP